MRSLSSIMVSKNFRPLFVFTMLSVLFVVTMSIMVNIPPQGSDAVTAVLNTAVGAITTMLTIVVKHEFSDQRGGDQGTRSTDSTGPVPTASTPVAEPAKG